MQVTQVLANLRQQEKVLRAGAEEVGAAIKLLSGLTGEEAPQGKGRKVKGKRKKMSAEARAKIAAAAKERWAKKKAAEK